MNGPLQRSYSQPRISSPLQTSETVKSSNRPSQNTNSPSANDGKITQKVSSILSRSKSKPVFSSVNMSRPEINIVTKYEVDP